MGNKNKNKRKECSVIAPKFEMDKSGEDGGRSLENIHVTLGERRTNHNRFVTKIRPTGEDLRYPINKSAENITRKNQLTPKRAAHAKKHKNTKQAYQLLGKTSVTVRLSFLNNDAALLSAARPSDTRPKSSMKPASAADIPLAA